jgi:hypothetical protein
MVEWSVFVEWSKQRVPRLARLNIGHGVLTGPSVSITPARHPDHEIEAALPHALLGDGQRRRGLVGARRRVRRWARADELSRIRPADP